MTVCMKTLLLGTMDVLLDGVKPLSPMARADGLLQRREISSTKSGGEIDENLKAAEGVKAAATVEVFSVMRNYSAT